MPTKSGEAVIPTYVLSDFRHVHRVPDEQSEFGYNSLARSKFIDAFELYSSSGLVGSVGPLRSAFYRISLTITGGLDMQIGLECYRHEPRTIGFTFPNQLFFKNNISADASGYYMLFEEGFLADLLPAAPGCSASWTLRAAGCLRAGMLGVRGSWFQRSLSSRLLVSEVPVVEAALALAVLNDVGVVCRGSRCCIDRRRAGGLRGRAGG